MRREKRPQLETVVQVFDDVFERFRSESDFRQVLRGPETWSWVDATAAHLGYEKWFVLTTSTMEGAEGYPLLTIRQSVAPRLDSWISVSQLVMGPTPQEIEGALSLAIANHLGAYLGLRQSVTDVVESLSGKPADQAFQELLGNKPKEVN